MKYHLFVGFLILCARGVFAQAETIATQQDPSGYEQQVLQNSNATHLELLMAMSPDASPERTRAVKQELDAFIGEIKTPELLRLSEVKLMKELHAKVHKRFLKRYAYVSPFDEIFVSGQYNCVSATALFALVLEELQIPYAIQEQPTHVYIMAYPETKAISVEMTAVKDAYYLPARKDVSKAVNVLLELKLTTPEEIRSQGELQVYNTFYNANEVVDLRQLAGIQYWNAAITAVNANDYPVAFAGICKAEKLYDVQKTRLFKTELLLNLLQEAKFDRMQDVRYLAAYANLEKAEQSKVYYQYATFLSEQLIAKGRRDLADSSHAYMAQNVTDTVLAAKLGAIYYLGMSEYFPTPIT